VQTIEADQPVAEAINMMSKNDFSQMPVTRQGRIVGAINERNLYALLIKNTDIRKETVENIMQPAFPFTDISTPVKSLAHMLNGENDAVLVKDFKTDSTFILTKADIIKALN
ncbi:MAG: CBS domain-containing protein, partial [Bacteroidota bacterium]